MIIKNITLDQNRQEFPANAGRDFPLTAHYTDLGQWATPAVPWHWHRELEFCVVLQGRLHVYTSHQDCVLAPGEGYFLNRNVLHRVQGEKGDKPVYMTQLVDAGLLAGAEGSVFQRKYVDPVLECRQLELLPLRLASTNQRQIIGHVNASYDAADGETEGYEIIARNELSMAWLGLMRELPQGALDGDREEDQTEIRVKRMMLYIQEHSAERLTLDEIAMAASISPRECLRDFQQRLHTTPIRYLIDWRLGTAARRLVSTGQPVTDIAADCGFSSGSYFTKLFREKYHMTPMQYRKKHAGL